VVIFTLDYPGRESNPACRDGIPACNPLDPRFVQSNLICFLLQTLSVIGGLLMVVSLGPGGVSMDEHKKKW